MNGLIRSVVMATVFSLACVMLFIGNLRVRLGLGLQSW